jgi:hypothetical protein
MTSGGLMQLVAYGAQDVYLTANPQVTFFKQLYRRHSNFAMESIEQTFNGVANFGKRVTCTIARNGDLISKMYLQATLPCVVTTDATGFKWVDKVGAALIKSVEVEIGGQQIDKHYGDWLNIWNELTREVGKKAAWNGLVSASITEAVAEETCDPCKDECRVTPTTERTLYIPLEFWFNRHTGLALPLIALQYHEVKINLELNELRYLCNTTASTDTLTDVARKGLVAASLYVDYIYLDTEERRRFAQVAHEYLIEQLQFTGEESVTSSSNKIQMSFNHPVKELVWVVQSPSYIDCEHVHNKPFRYTTVTGDCNPTAVAKLQLNGHDRFSEREGAYFSKVQPFQHHTGNPNFLNYGGLTAGVAQADTLVDAGICVYSFALKPEDLQPSGSCNFSRIDNAVLNLTLRSGTFDSTKSLTSANVRIYAVNYNVLRIMSGMGGLAYSN